jgi:hypothetical protein
VSPDPELIYGKKDFSPYPPGRKPAPRSPTNRLQTRHQTSNLPVKHCLPDEKPKLTPTQATP